MTSHASTFMSNCNQHSRETLVYPDISRRRGPPTALSGKVTSPPGALAFKNQRSVSRRNLFDIDDSAYPHYEVRYLWSSVVASYAVPKEYATLKQTCAN